MYCGWCTNCERTLRRCSKCQVRWYCSQECQKADWVEMHKKVCGKGEEDVEQVLETKWGDAVVEWHRAIARADGQLLMRVVEKFRICADHAGLVKGRMKNWDEVWLARVFLFVGLCLSDKLFNGMGNVDLVKLYLGKPFELCPSKSLFACCEMNLVLEQSNRFQEAREFAQRVIGAHVENLEWVNPWQRPGFFDKSLRSQAFWDTASFPWVQILESNYEIILSELKQVLSNRQWGSVGGSHRESGQEDGMVLAKGSWTELILFGRGMDETVCPKTRNLLIQHCQDAIDICDSFAGEIILSRLSPNTHITPHCAASNQRLTAHLGLVVPPSSSGKCRIRVGEEWRGWEAGKVLMFDDSFEHEVRNDTNHERIVLLIRFFHPDLNDKVQRYKSIQETVLSRERLFHRRSFPPVNFATNRNGLEEENCNICPKCHFSENVQVDLIMLAAHKMKITCRKCNHMVEYPSSFC